MEASDKVSKHDGGAENNATPDVLVDALTSKFKGFEFLDSKNSLIAPVVSYPPAVERRIKALKKLQFDMLNTECKFFQELHELEAKYSLLHENNCKKRSEIISGKYEPTDGECDFETCGPEEEKMSENGKKNLESGNSSIVGVPRFWLTIFQNVEQLADMIESYDLPILEHLEDVKMEVTKQPMGFKLFFHFSPNEYFTNPVLIKSYEMRVHIDPKDPFSFEGTEICKSTGCKIDWKEGKDVTVREIKKKQKHKSTGVIRMTNKIIASPSFFDFFNPPQIEENDNNVEPELQDKLTVDFEVGSFMKERIIPRAVLYFTGEALDSEDEEEEEFTDEDTEEEDESGNERLIDSVVEDDE